MEHARQITKTVIPGLVPGTHGTANRDTRVGCTMGPGNKCRDDTGVVTICRDKLPTKPKRSPTQSLREFLRRCFRPPSTVIPGLVPWSHGASGPFRGNGHNAGQCWIEIEPMGVCSFNQVDLPTAGPFLHGLFALNGLLDTGEGLEPHQPMNPVASRKLRACALAMLADPKHEPVRHPDVERAPRFTCQDIYPVFKHQTPHSRQRSVRLDGSRGQAPE